MQAGISLGVVVAQAINAGTQHIYPWGWRLSIALAAVPALMFTVSAWALPDTPSSLLSRGRSAEVLFGVCEWCPSLQAMSAAQVPCTLWYLSSHLTSYMPATTTAGGMLVT